MSKSKDSFFNKLHKKNQLATFLVIFFERGNVLPFYLGVSHMIWKFLIFDTNRISSAFGRKIILLHRALVHGQAIIHLLICGKFMVGPKFIAFIFMQSVICFVGILMLVRKKTDGWMMSESEREQNYECVSCHQIFSTTLLIITMKILKFTK